MRRRARCPTASPEPARCSAKCAHPFDSLAAADRLAFGQEKNITTYNPARMNMLLHGVKDTEFEIFHGDTLTNEWDILCELNPAKRLPGAIDPTGSMGGTGEELPSWRMR